MSKTWRAVVGIFFIFVLGWVGGALTTAIVMHHKALVLLRGGPQAVMTLLERRTTHNLGLNASQQQQVHAAFMENLQQRLELQRQVQPQVKALNYRTLQEIDAVLTPDEQEQFQKNLAQFKERFGRNPFNNTETNASTAPTPPVNTGSGTNAPAASQ
ncbi:MAG: hypothetical protein LV480_05475 [Methylacidiphilales bacterium]|nr:hypothetical protein [Candidatus Methylacidiphilales bacterium]